MRYGNGLSTLWRAWGPKLWILYLGIPSLFVGITATLQNRPSFSGSLLALELKAAQSDT